MHSLMTAIFGPVPRAFTTHGLEAKTAWDRLQTLTETISAKEHNINSRKKLVILQGFPASKFGELWSTNG